MTNRKRVAHTATFLQTFHTGQTTAARRESAGAEGSEPRPAAPEAAAVSFVKTGRSAKFADFTTDRSYLADYRGIQVKHGEGLITEPQAKYVVSIALEREGVTEQMLDSLKTRLLQGFAKVAASQFISTYKDLPRKSAPAPVVSIDPGKTFGVAVAPAPELTDGIYVDVERGRVFKLQFNKAQGSGTSLYAKQLSLGFYGKSGDWEDHNEGLLTLDLEGVEKEEIQRSWDYERGLVSRIRPEWRLTPEAAVAYGALYGVCIRCQRNLTKESSIRQMMGDTCAGKQGF